MSRIVGRKYALEDLLGRGSMGSVYRARHVLTNQVVALKLIAPEIANTPNGRHRFGREVRVAATVGHSGLVQVFDAGTEHETNTLYLAMELLTGENLKDRSRQLDFSLRMGLQFVRATLDALAAAHAHGFVHRDIKPENIFIHQPRPNVEEVKLLDFGIARDLAEDAQSSTAAHIALGTPHYMSPEQATNAREVTAATDVWSVGVMMYWLLAGRLPFDEDTAFNTLAKVCGSDPQPIDPQGSELRAQLSQLTYACLAKDPDGRPSNASHLAAMLDQILGPFVLSSSQESAAYTRPASSTFEQVAPAFGPYSTPPHEGLAAPLVQTPQTTTQTLPFVGGSSDISAKPAFQWKVAALGAIFFLFAGVALTAWYLQGSVQSLTVTSVDTAPKTESSESRSAVEPGNRLNQDEPSPIEAAAEPKTIEPDQPDQPDQRRAARSERRARNARRAANARRRRATADNVANAPPTLNVEPHAGELAAPTIEPKVTGAIEAPAAPVATVIEPAEEPSAPSLPAAAPAREPEQKEPPANPTPAKAEERPSSSGQPDRPAPAPEKPDAPKKKTKSNKKKTEDFLTF